MTQFISEKLKQFDAKKAEQIYGEIYQYCQGDGFSAEEANLALTDFMVWIERGDLIEQSYGLLFIGAVIDSGKLRRNAEERLVAFFIEKARLVENFAVLDDENRFVHLVSHFAYLAASYCEQFGGHQQTIVEQMVMLFLRAPEPHWCGEELLVARLMLEVNLPDKVFKQFIVSLKPQIVRQSADQWGSAEANAWRKATLVEAHKRQLLMALQCVNSKMSVKPPTLFRSSNKAIFATKFG